MGLAPVGRGRSTSTATARPDPHGRWTAIPLQGRRPARRGPATAPRALPQVGPITAPARSARPGEHRARGPVEAPLTTLVEALHPLLSKAQALMPERPGGGAQGRGGPGWRRRPAAVQRGPRRRFIAGRPRCLPPARPPMMRRCLRWCVAAQWLARCAPLRR